MFAADWPRGPKSAGARGRGGQTVTRMDWLRCVLLPPVMLAVLLTMLTPVMGRVGEMWGDNGKQDFALHELVALHLSYWWRDGWWLHTPWMVGPWAVAEAVRFLHGRMRRTPRPSSP